jgi:hypothetical protein
MPGLESSCPMKRSAVIDAYFMEHRAKLIDVAAFLDRVDRARPEAGADDDFRLRAFRSALAILSDGKPERARRVLDVFSDPSSEPIESAAGMKGAYGAHAGK